VRSRLCHPELFHLTQATDDRLFQLTHKDIGVTIKDT